MSDFAYGVIGLLAAFHGVGVLERARNGSIRPSSVVWSVVAGYLAWEHSWLLTADGWLRLSGVAIWFAATSPLLGYFLYANEGVIIHTLIRAISFLLLSAALTALWLWRLEPRQAIIAGLLTALLPFLPWSGIRSWIRQARQKRRERREQRREAKRQARELRRQQSDQAQMRELRRSAKRSSRTLHVQAKRLAALERGEQRERERLVALREETIEQVRLVRNAEVERIKTGEEAFEFHPHYGFVIAETRRTLRAEIATGQRPAAMEHDAFLFQVLEELLTVQDFERRYLHETGRKAIASVNRYFSGQQPLSLVRTELEALDWLPELLAPIPIRGELVPGLLEDWLIPHRRRQQLDCQRFCSGDHPRQDQLNDSFDEREIELPTLEQWRQIWDENPAVFVG